MSFKVTVFIESKQQEIIFYLERLEFLVLSKPSESIQLEIKNSLMKLFRLCVQYFHLEDKLVFPVLTKTKNSLILELMDFYILESNHIKEKLSHIIYVQNYSNPNFEKINKSDKEVIRLLKERISGENELLFPLTNGISNHKGEAFIQSNYEKIVHEQNRIRAIKSSIEMEKLLKAGKLELQKQSEKIVFFRSFKNAINYLEQAQQKGSKEASQLIHELKTGKKTFSVES